ncbi:hypothetical protein MOE50_05020 [Bacillus inaquosorum]|uniref:hypothetical protein n=1 Tax=Bacillus inaquosorum TaxID=483913 RepID=UPI00227E7852|nr:hypothetical protein [Bacillus inaquosorum]MCY9008363.1 hypothetical protein [Bacillus inaquosorum]MCY9038573.1 hypothetical protein [Bacillus inaquosorum]MCY9043821.1 hypothetical protein [Bacillus inaquosorum]
MTETNANASGSIHILADETLGGIKREYVEVDRKAEVGDLIANGDLIGKFRYNSGIFTHVYYDGAYSGEDVWFTNKCRVIEPTDIVHIDGPDGTERYELTDRKAEVGEKVIVVKDDGTYEIGSIFTTKETDRWLDGSGISVEEFNYGLFHKEYRVLVPVETADEPKPSDPIFAIGNVAQEVAKLKRTVSDLETTIERHELVNDRLKDEIDTLHKDNRTLGEELARLKEPAKSESIIESAPFVLVIHEGRGEFDVYQRGKKIENISRLEIEAYSRISSSIDLEFNDVGERP